MSDTATVSRFYDDLDTFFTERGLSKYADGSWREDSYDYGCWWSDEHGANWMLVWIGERGREPGTGGELYAKRLGPPRAGMLAPGVVMVSAGTGDGVVEFFGTIPAAVEDPDHEIDRYPGSANDPGQIVEAVLKGWADVCGEGPNSLGWVRDRIARAIADGLAKPPS